MEPVRGNHKVHFYHAWVESMDLTSKQLTLMPAYPPAFQEEDPLLVHAAADKGQTSSPGRSQGRFPNTRGGHGVIMTSAPHRRAIESRDEGETEKQSKQRGHHSHQLGETWHSMEHGRDYTLPFDKLVVACVSFDFGQRSTRVMTGTLLTQH